MCGKKGDVSFLVRRILYLDEGGVPGHQVLPGPVDLLAADVTVDVSVRTDGKNVNAEYYLQ